ncbi:MAG: ABC transporter substrate-binding protein, partial [Actinomycetota bacterium]|nr:ABC transporter substrate-binding protein [Actinomycetota bacterium]
MNRIRGNASRSVAVRRSYSRRDFLKLGGAGLAGAALLGTSACGGGGGGGGGGNVVFTYGATGSEDLRTVRELVDRFNQENENGITVEFQRRSEVTDEYFRSLVSDFQAGSASMDVIVGDVVWAAEFAQNGWIEDLSSRMYSDYQPQVPDAFLEAPISSVSYQNSLWGVPWFTDVGVLYYRRDLLEEAGLGSAPSTWSGLKDIANQVMEQADVQHGFVFQGADYEGGVVNGAEYIWNAGAEIMLGNVTALDSDRPRSLTPNFVVLDNPNAVQGLRTERSMITDNVAPQEVADYTETDSNDAFRAGDAVFQRGWPFMYATFGADDSQINQDQVEIAPLPTEEEGQRSWSCLGGWNMYINSGSQNKDAAWEFIKFMTAAEQQRFRALEASFLPTLNSLYEDQELLNQVPVIDRAKDIVREDARNRPITPYYSIISRRLASGFHSSLTGETDPEQVVQNLS